MLGSTSALTTLEHASERQAPMAPGHQQYLTSIYPSHRSGSSSRRADQDFRLVPCPARRSHSYTARAATWAIWDACFGKSVSVFAPYAPPAACCPPPQRLYSVILTRASIPVHVLCTMMLCVTASASASASVHSLTAVAFALRGCGKLHLQPSSSQRHCTFQCLIHPAVASPAHLRGSSFARPYTCRIGRDDLCKLAHNFTY